MARAESAASARIGVIQRMPSGRRLAGLGRNADRRRARERAEPHGVGLAGAGGGVEQAAAARGHRRPDLALERERAPAARGEPRLGRRRNISHRATVSDRGACPDASVVEDADVAVSGCTRRTGRRLLRLLHLAQGVGADREEPTLAEQVVDVAVDVRTLDAAVQQEGFVRAREAERRVSPCTSRSPLRYFARSSPNPMGAPLRTTVASTFQPSTLLFDLTLASR